jgi:hypothetical protein
MTIAKQLRRLEELLSILNLSFDDPIPVIFFEKWYKGFIYNLRIPLRENSIETLPTRIILPRILRLDINSNRACKPYVLAFVGEHSIDEN